MNVNTSLQLRGQFDDGSTADCLVVLPVWLRQPVVTALEEAGFTVVRQSTPVRLR